MRQRQTGREPTSCKAKNRKNNLKTLSGGQRQDQNFALKAIREVSQQSCLEKKVGNQEEAVETVTVADEEHGLSHTRFENAQCPMIRSLCDDKDGYELDHKPRITDQIWLTTLLAYADLMKGDPKVKPCPDVTPFCDSILRPPDAMHRAC